MSDSLPVVASEGYAKPLSCTGCPNEASQCVTRGIWIPDARLTFLGESPSWASIGAEAASGGMPFRGQNGLLLRRLMEAISGAFEEQIPGGIKYNMAYAAGAMGKPSQDVVNQCSNIWKSQWVSEYTQQQGAHVIVPLGLPAAKSTGISAKKILDIRGRTSTRMLGDKQVIVLPTLSLASVYAKPGFAQVVQGDILRAVKLAYLDVYTPPKSIEELSKNYVFPKTLEEVKKVCDDVISYTDPEKQPDAVNWPITVDIETNTLKAFRKDAKVLMISFGWDDGKATAILLDHAENKFYPADQAWKEVQRVLECQKPKAFHNFKFDGQFLERVKGIRVNNVVWDTLCGQHWISEDQKGVYGLKALAPTYAPEYEGYEEKLHAALRYGEEVAPTEEDVLKEAQELAAASGSGSDGAWFEGGYDGEEEEEEVLSNDKWLADPEWPADAKPEWIEKYKEARNKWFDMDSLGKGKERGQELRKWKKWAAALNLPTPEPIPAKDINKQKEGWEAIDINTILPYAAADADVTRIILKKHYRKLAMTECAEEAHRVMDSLYVPASRTLGGLEFRGAKVNLEMAQEYDSQLSVILDDTQKRIYDLACKHFKINASKQLAKVLVELGFRSVKETKGGDMSTSKDVIIGYQKALVADLATKTDPAEITSTNRRIDFIEALLLFRAAHKMKTSFLKRIREYASLDGHIHTTFHLTGTSTGRLSSSKLNLQNLPLYMCRVTRPNPANPDEPLVISDGFNVKALLIPETDDEVFWNLDIKAAEIRVAAYYSGDEQLIKALNDGLDVHTFFLTKIKHPEFSDEALREQYAVYNKLIKEDDPDLTLFRSAVKRVVFGTLYGAGARKIAAQIGDNYPMEKAQDIIKALFTAFPGIKKYVDDTKKSVRENSQVNTIFGRYRRFSIAAVSRELSSKAEREAVNFRVQSTSSDLVVSQLCEIDDHLHEIEAVMRLTVHDSMAGTVKKHRVKEMKAFFDYWLVQRVKERFPWLPVPFLYDLEIGPSYGVKKKYSEWVKDYDASQQAVAA
jgi:DNA polymerase I-like protein with 3'-5' exonuclease and polymerase domains/uracil-DNA glycosylase